MGTQPPRLRKKTREASFAAGLAGTATFCRRSRSGKLVMFAVAVPAKPAAITFLMLCKSKAQAGLNLA